MIEANNKSVLEGVLKRLDISVPRRSDGRTKGHAERYAIAHLLSALLAKDQLSYPLRLIHRERPDFLLRAGGVDIGIEHTEVTPQNDAHKTVWRDEIDGPEVYFISHYQPGEAKKSAKDLIQEIQANYSGPGWVGDEVEREWTEAMLYFVRGKIDTIAKDGFEKFERNWLLIYDNWSLPALNREMAAKLLLPEIEKLSCFVKFDALFIITGNLICEFSSAGFVQHEINDLWP